SSDHVQLTLCMLVSKGWNDQEGHDETQSDPNGNFEEPIDHQVFLALVITVQYENRCCHNGHAFVTDPIQPCGNQADQQGQGKGCDTHLEKVANHKGKRKPDGGCQRRLDPS